MQAGIKYKQKPNLPYPWPLLIPSKAAKATNTAILYIILNGENIEEFSRLLKKKLKNAVFLGRQ